MSFDAGAITGRLGLDISSFTGSLAGAGVAGGNFQTVIAATVIQTLAAVASAAVGAGEAIAGMIVQMGRAGAESSFAAEKAGVTVEAWAEQVGVAKAVGVSAEQVATSYKLLQRNAVDALEGNDKAAKSFADVNVPLSFLRQHLSDNTGLMAAVRAGIESLPDPALKAQRAIEVLGRSGSEAVPFLSLSSEKYKEIADNLRAVGGLETSASAEAGRSFSELSAYVEGAWEGIKRAVAEPILAGLKAHMGEIVPVLVGLSKFLRDAIEAAFYVIGPIVDAVKPAFLEVAHALQGAAVPAFAAVLNAVQQLTPHLKGLADAGAVAFIETFKTVGATLLALLPSFTEFAIVAADVLAEGFRAAAPVIREIGPEIIAIAGTISAVLVPSLKQLGFMLESTLTTTRALLKVIPVNGFGLGPLLESINPALNVSPGGRAGGFSAGGGAGGGQQIVVNVTSNVAANGQDVADKVVADLHPKIKKAHDEATTKYAAKVTHTAVAKGIGGKHK